MPSSITCQIDSGAIEIHPNQLMMSNVNGRREDLAARFVFYRGSS
jgi:hypothetical protein